ncbi:3-deoxy-7-phosphoheptulonate synthase [Orbaceae bacterium ESL0721]|nr:3-deoxy-7-phosphoheptulonate synthase [Orbaceae bacterium ESL0721]
MCNISTMRNISTICNSGNICNSDLHNSMANALSNSAVKQLITPQEIKQNYPLTDQLKEQVEQYRQTIINILERRDHRLLVVCGPCSVHDPIAAIEYAKKLKRLSDELKDHLFIIMRVYFEKPRTTVGWKGMINDPHMDGSYDIEHGLKQARQLLLAITQIGLPIATEALDPNTPHYISDLISWSAIGARTTESQTHREMASGLTMPVGFKNGTDGNLAVAINAIQSATMPHRFIGLTQSGEAAIIETTGNRYGHIILRGGKTPNFDAKHITECEAEMQKADLIANIMVDCSHANSNKDYRNQPLVADAIIAQIEEGNNSIIGVMVESNLIEGNQPANRPLDQLNYGISVTDGCINWQTTDQLLRKMARKLADPLVKRSLV